MNRLKEKYETSIKKELTEKFGYTTPMQYQSLKRLL